MSDFDFDSPLLSSLRNCGTAERSTPRDSGRLATALSQGSDRDACLYASLMTMFDAGFAAALKLEKDKGESSTVA